MASQAIGAGLSILGGITGSKGAKKAAAQQAAAYQKGLDEQRRQFDITNQNFQPFLQTGTEALNASGDLLGLNGNGTQQTAIEALKASPAFTSLFNTGQDTVLQNAAATGGLRGGNTTNSLANFGSSLLASVIERQLANLGGLSSIGSGAAGQLGQFGQNSANSISDLLGKQGNAQATGTAAQSAIWQNVIKDVGGSIGALGKSQGWKGW